MESAYTRNRARLNPVLPKGAPKVVVPQALLSLTLEDLKQRILAMDEPKRSAGLKIVEERHKAGCSSCAKRRIAAKLRYWLAQHEGEK